MNLGDVLGSATIAAVVTLVSNYLVSVRKGKLTHITSERKKWRDEIRKIAKKLSEADSYSKQKQQIAKLKVRLNTFGITKGGCLCLCVCSFKEIDEDVHIWGVIRRIEKEYAGLSKKRLKKKKVSKQSQKNVEILIEYLSLLLKMDWNRAKREVKGIPTSICEAVMDLIVGVIIIVAAIAGYYLFFSEKDIEPVVLDMVKVFGAGMILADFVYIIKMVVVIIDIKKKQKIALEACRSILCMHHINDD